MQFLKSYTTVVDSLHTIHRDKHIDPNATIHINGGPGTPIRRLVKLLSIRSTLAMNFHHKIWRAWAISEVTTKGPRETVLVNWQASATHLRYGTSVGPDNFDRTDQSKFTILELGQAPEGKGVQGLWLVKSQNWMDALLRKKVQQKVLTAVLMKLYPGATLAEILMLLEPEPQPDTEIEDYVTKTAVDDPADRMGSMVNVFEIVRTNHYYTARNSLQ